MKGYPEKTSTNHIHSRPQSLKLDFKGFEDIVSLFYHLPMIELAECLAAITPGSYEKRILLRPPLIISSEDTEVALEIFETVLKEVL